MRRVLTPLVCLALLSLPLVGQTVVRRPVLVAAGGGSPVTIDTATSNATCTTDCAPAGTPLTFTYTSSGTNRAVIVSISHWSGGPVNAIASVSYDGAALTRIIKRATAGEDSIDVWGLTNQSTTTNAVISIQTDDATGMDDMVIGVVSFNGAHQTFASCFTNTNSAENTTNSATLTITLGSSNSLAFVGFESYIPTATISVGTQRFNATDAGTLKGFGGTNTGTTTSTITFSLDDTNWVGAGCSVNPV